MKPWLTPLNLNQRFKANFVNTLVLYPSKEVQGNSICWQNDGFCFLRFWWYNHERQPGKWKTINGQYYAPKLKQLKEAIKLKCRGKLKADVLLLQDNVPIHTAQVDSSWSSQLWFWIAIPSPLTHQTQLHLTSSCFLNTNLTCMVAISETMMRSYMLLRSF